MEYPRKAELAPYGDLLGDIKGRIRAAQSRAAQAVNTELVRLCWDIGRLIAARQQQAAGVPELSRSCPRPAQ